MTVTLSADPERAVSVPLSKTNQGGASDSDYSGVPASVVFGSGDTEKTFTFEATQDTIDDDGESVDLAFGTLPEGVSAGTPSTSTVSITDDDDPAVSVSFGQSSYTVDEGGSATVTVTLSADPERAVSVPLSKTNQGGASDSDYSGVPASVVFGSGETEKSFTFNAQDDSDNDDGESVDLAFGNLPDRVTAGSPSEATVSITDDDDPTVSASFGQSSYTVDEGGSATVTVTLSADPERAVSVPLSKTNQGGASDSDYSGVPASVEFQSGETEKSFTFNAQDDSDNDDGESVDLAFGTLPDRVTAGSPSEATVSITDDDDPTVSASFGQSSYTVDEGGSATVTVTLSADPERAVSVPLSKTNQGGASDSDYSGVPASVEFQSGETEKSFTFNAQDDSDNDDGESVDLAFGTLPEGVSAGTPSTSTVSITDDDLPSSVAVEFEASSYSVNEGGEVEVTVKLNVDPERSVTIPLSKTNQGGASDSDYSGVPASVVFGSGDTEKTFTFEATQDTIDDDGESVDLAFGTLPEGVSAGTPSTSTVSITDDDDPAVSVSFGQSSYTVDEGGSATVTVTLSADPERAVSVPLSKTNQGGASDSDYSGVPASVVFGSGDTEKTFTFEATQDTIDDDGESVDLAFGTLPEGVSAGTPSTSTVSITDDDDPAVSVSFGQSSYTVDEGGSATVTVTLSADPERAVSVPLSKTNQGGASDSDYSGVPASVVFGSGETEKSFTFNAQDDSDNDDGESVDLAFGTLPDRVTAGSPSEATVSITDDDDPTVSASFGQSSYTVDEGGSATVTVTLSADPERAVSVPLSKTNQGGASDSDYSGVPASVEFQSGETEKSFTFEATQDTIDDDGESVKLAFGTLPEGVSAGTPSTSTVSITDDDDPTVSASFGQSSYTVDEGGSATVTVTLSADPERAVSVPLSKTNQGGASDSDYSGVPASVVFGSGDTEKTFTFEATQDTIDDDGESVDLAFGTLPEGVSAGTPSTSTVSITDDDDPAVSVSFGQSSYTVDEGGSATVTVTLSADPGAGGERPAEQDQPGRGVGLGLLRGSGQRGVPERGDREELHLRGHSGHD